MTGFRPARAIFALLIVLGLGLGGVAEAQAQAQSADVAKVGVRAGAHDVYTRLVFDWREKVAYEVSRDGGLVTLTFDKPADIDAERINRRLPLYVGGVRSARTDQRTVVIVAVPPKSAIKNFYAGTRIVLDVREPAKWQEPATLPAEVAVPGTDGQVTATASTRDDLTAFAAQSLNDLMSGKAPAPSAQPKAAAPAVPAQPQARQQPARPPVQQKQAQPQRPLSLTPPARQAQPAPQTQPARPAPQALGQTRP
ncbi:MAG: hypothetical protein VW268_13515, partial [Rhodospirillaceae bacterium]